MAEISMAWTPYNYVENNALINSDPTGMYSEDALFNAAKNDPNTKNVYTANGYGTGSENEETRDITRNKEGKPTGVRIGFGNATENQDCCPGPCCPENTSMLQQMYYDAGYRFENGQVYDPYGHKIEDVAWYEYLSNLVEGAWIGSPLKAFTYCINANKAAKGVGTALRGGMMLLLINLYYKVNL